MFCYALNSILYYFDIEVIFLSTFSGLSILTWIFLYISSFVFKFCIYHRLPLYYILTIDIINYYDYLIGLPISDKRLFVLDIIINGIKVKYAQLEDITYVANMCKADYLKGNIPTEQHLAMYVHETLDDPDGCEGLVFNRWIADMKWLGIAIP